MKEFKGDKRTKEYKLWKAAQIETKDAVGLGDVVEKITEATGIKKVVKAVFGKDCGCDERKRLLNINFTLGIGRYKAQRCLTEEQYNDYGAYIKRRTLAFSRADVKLLIDLFAHVFAIQYNPKDFCTNCGGSAKKLMTMQTKLDKVYNSYKND